MSDIDRRNLLRSAAWAAPVVAVAATAPMAAASEGTVTVSFAYQSSTQLNLAFELDPKFEGEMVAAYFSMTPMIGPTQQSPLFSSLSSFDGSFWSGSLLVLDPVPYSDLTFQIPGYNAITVPLPFTL